MSQCFPEASGHIRKFFPAPWLNSLARQTGLVQRSSSKIDGADMCQLLIQAVNAPVELSLGGFCKMLYQINRNAKLKAQSLWERIVNPAAVTFAEKVYAKTWSLYAEKIKKECSKYSCHFFEQFSQMWKITQTLSSKRRNIRVFPILIFHIYRT